LLRWRKQLRRTPIRADTAEYDNSVKYISDFLQTQERPFDGVIGFSQGAAMTAALTALLEKDGLSPQFTRGSATPLKFAIAVGGFKPRSKTPDFSAYFPVNTPVLHVVGAQDPVVSAKASKQLQDATPTSRAVGHDGGHWTPGNSQWQKFFSDFIASMGKGGKLGDTAAPGEESARL
jgi:predicted esterase